MNNINLESERLVYKRLSSEHVSDTYVGWLNDPQVNSYTEVKGGYTIEMLANYVEHHYNKEVYFWAIHLKDTNKHIGNIKIDPINKALNSGEYGILIGDQTSWGKGYAKEASITIINYCFNILKLNKITLGVIEDNRNAVALYKKMGFEIDEIKTNAGVYNNKPCNALRMSLSYQKNKNLKLVLGTVQMGLAYGINNSKGQVSEVESFKILQHAFDNGIEMLDTAAVYGNAHEIIGRFHEKFPQKQFKIITKLPSQINDTFAVTVNNYINELRVDYLHTLLFHSFSSYQENLKHFKTLKQLKSDKKIKHLGVSVYTNDEIKKVAENNDIDIIQLPFNLFDNLNLRGEAIAMAKARGKTIHTRSALLQGLFFKDIHDSNPVVKKLNTELAEVVRLADEHKMPISQLAINYCLQQKNIDNVLIGVDSLDQLKENITAVSCQLDSKIIDEINSIKIKDSNLLNPSLWN